MPVRPRFQESLRALANRPRMAAAAPAAIALLFVFLACIMIPHAGIESDEGFFTWPIYGPMFDKSFGIDIFHKHLTLMIFPYAGALKTLLYWPLLTIFRPNPWAMRLPVVAIGAVTIFVFIRWTERIAGQRAALLAGLLLATDPSFILTDTFDWGPVALEHLLLVTGCLLMVSRRPAVAFFCFGLAFWNKAIFVWAFTGLALATIIVYWPQTRRFIADRRRFARCALAFALGALPLIVYNIHAPNATAHANIHPSFEGFGTRIISLRQTLDGSALFGIVAAMDSEGSPKTLRSLYGRLSSAANRITGTHYHSLFFYGVLLALLLSPFWWRSEARRPALFAIVFSVIFFVMMSAVRYTGAAHHIVLMYPMPQLLVGVAIASLRPPRLAGIIAALLLAANLLVVNQYVAQFEKYGAFGLFTDALYPLSDFLTQHEGNTIYTMDLGIRDSLNAMNQGRLHMRESVIPSMSVDDIRAIVANPAGIFVGRTERREYYTGASARLDSVAAASGYRRKTLQSIRDSNGRIQFVLFGFTKE